jgi:DNA-binding transcriptional regulator YiaG
VALKIRLRIHSRRNPSRCSKATIRLRRPKRWWLDAAEFRELRRSCLLSQRACAEFLGIAQGTVRNWDRGRSRVPKVVIRLLRLRRNGELGDLEPAWEGWLLRGDRLISPEGREFRPQHMSYWANTVAMAELWRSERGSTRLSAGGDLHAAPRVADACPAPAVPAEPLLRVCRGRQAGARAGAQRAPATGLVIFETTGVRKVRIQQQCGLQEVAL